MSVGMKLSSLIDSGMLNVAVWVAAAPLFIKLAKSIEKSTETAVRTHREEI